jgi:hypothetical protein
MAAVIAALLPVFLLIVLGFILKRSLMRLDTQWHGLERLTYYVLFPMLLIQTLVKADLTKVPVAGVGGALLLAALLMSLLCLALRPLLARLAVDGPAFTSIFQGSVRWQTYVALSVSANLYGDAGLALASVAMVAIIPLVNVFSVAVLAHYAAPERQSVRTIVMTVVKNPLIWACGVGLALNVLHLPLQKIWHEVADALVAGDRAVGHRRRPASRRAASPEPRRRGRRVSEADPDAGAGNRAGAVVWSLRRQSRDRCGLLGRAGVFQFLCAGAADGRRCAAARADHHAANHPGRDHHAAVHRPGGPGQLTKPVRLERLHGFRRKTDPACPTICP